MIGDVVPIPLLDTTHTKMNLARDADWVSGPGCGGEALRGTYKGSG
jgi:hypothetical protein